MKILITGGAGFLGKRLVARLLARADVDEIVLVDVAQAEGLADPRVRTVAGDITDSTLMASLVDAGTAGVFHLAAVVSGQAEADFELGMRINLDASRLLLDLCRRRGHKPRVVFTSSVAVYGGDLPDVVTDDLALRPASSYGTQKAIAELLLADYSRRGFVDGRVLRLPTVSVRPGLPNKAASSFASGIIREPLNGEDAVCPVAPGTRLWLLSPRCAGQAGGPPAAGGDGPVGARFRRRSRRGEPRQALRQLHDPVRRRSHVRSLRPGGEEQHRPHGDGRLLRRDPVQLARSTGTMVASSPTGRSSRPASSSRWA